MNDLTGKVAIVTACSRGIGFAIVKKFVEDGATVYMAVRDSDKDINLTNKLHAENDHYRRVVYNAIDFSSYKPMVDEVVKDAGRIDILVNNFGTTDIVHDLTLTTGDPEKFFAIIKENIGSVYYGARYVVEQMMKQKTGGSIVNISSVAGTTPDVSRLAYTTSKAAIDSLTRNIAVQYARQQIRCNAVLPGMVDTDAIKKLSKDFTETFLNNVPLGRFVEPEDIADAVAFLASDKSRNITGELIPVCGGFGLPTPIYSDVISGKIKQN